MKIKLMIEVFSRLSLLHRFMVSLSVSIKEALTLTHLYLSETFHYVSVWAQYSEKQTYHGFIVGEKEYI